MKADLIFIREHVFAPKGARDCVNHLENGHFPYESFKNLTIYMTTNSHHLHQMILKHCF